MSKALKCDRCKKCFTPEGTEGKMIRFQNPKVYTSEDLKPFGSNCTYLVNAGSPDMMLDLCPHCAERFLDFMWVKPEDSQKLPTL